MRQLTSTSTSLRFVVAMLPLMSLAGAGCRDDAPIDPEVMAEQAALHAREVVHQTGGGVSFTQSDDSGLAKIVSGMAHASDGVAGMASAIPPGMMSAMGDSPMARAAAGMPSLMTTEEQFDGTADDVRTWLRERILTAANLETKTNDEAVYLLHGDPTCRALPNAGDPPGTLPAPDAKCDMQLTKLQVRVVMRADGDGVRLAVQVGPDRLELSAFVIHSNLLALEADLAKAHAASQYIDTTLGTDSPMGDTQFEALAGGVRVALQKNGERQVTFTTSVTKAIHVATKSAAGALGPDFSLAATDPLLSISADGTAQTARLAVDVGAIDVLTSWSSASAPDAPANRDLHVAIGALTGALEFKEGTDELVAKGLGIGTTSLEVRGASIFTLGLNPGDMHRFDLKITLDAAGEPKFEIVPRFDLALGLHFGGVAADFGADSQPPSWALDELYGIRLDNGGAASAVKSAPATATFGGGIAVGPGTLTISSNKVADPVTVPSGKCLTGNKNPAAGAHPLLGALSVVDCP